MIKPGRHVAVASGLVITYDGTDLPGKTGISVQEQRRFTASILDKIPVKNSSEGRPSQQPMSYHVARRSHDVIQGK